MSNEQRIDYNGQHLLILCFMDTVIMATYR